MTTILSEILTISTAVKVGSGALAHKLGQKILATFKNGEANVKKAAADIKKDL